MSNEKKYGAALIGYCGPSFPETLSVVHNFLYGEDAHGFNAFTIISMLTQCDLKSEVNTITTDDGYSWFHSINVELDDGKTAVVALPWGQDWERGDQTRSDRHSALYVSRRVTEQEVNMVLETLKVLFEKHIS